MKSPDKDIDRALQAALKRKFDDFEAEATKASEDAIFSKQRASYWQSTRGRILAAAGLVIFLLSLPFLYFSFSDVKDIVAVSIPKNDSFNGPTKLQRAVPALDSQENDTALIIENKRSQLLNPVNRTVKLQAAAKMEKPALSVKSLTKAVETTQMINFYKSSKDRFSVPDKHDEKEISTPVQTSQDNLISSNFDREKINLSVDKKILAEDYDLKMIQKKPYLANNFKPVFNIQFDLHTTRNLNGVAYDKKKGLGFIFNITPLNTVQVLTVKGLPGITYQNVNVPSEISLNRLGYKFTAGLAKGAFQFIFSYGQLNQSFNYEIASDEFVLNQDTKNYTFVQKGVQYRQDNKLKFVGLGLKRHGIIKNESVFQNYFGDVGVEFSRELKTNTNVLWGNLALGKQVLLSKNAQLNIGPYLEYSFTKMVNPDTKFQNQPYQIGLSIGLRYLKR